MSNDEKTNLDKDKSPAKKKGSGDPVQRAARDDRLKKNLRANLMRRKQKARALRSDDGSDKD